MKIPSFENYLDKHISEANIIKNATIDHNTELNIYTIHSETHYDYCGSYYRGFTATTNSKAIIQDITVYIHSIIDTNFYNAFTNQYGLPNEIKVEDYRTIKKERFEDESTEVTEIFTSLKEGSFDENPHLIKWYKENYEIQIFIKREINITEIKFSLK
jgi:hypothetical protein